MDKEDEMHYIVTRYYGQNKNNDYSWPCTIINARYGGMSEGGAWLSFPVEEYQIHPDAAGGDFECIKFWEANRDSPIGKGATPSEAFEDMTRKLIEHYGLAEPRRLWIIVNKETGRRASMAAFFSKESAEETLEGWKERCRKGGRPDTKMEDLENLEVRESE